MWATSSGCAVSAQRHPAPGVDGLRLRVDPRRHPRVDRARADAVDGDPVSAELDRHALRQADDARLGRRIRAQPGGGHDRFRRRDVHDAPRPGRHEVRYRQADESGVRCEIDVERAGPVRFEVTLRLERRVDERDPRVVDHDVQPARPLDRSIDERSEFVEFSDVAHDAEHRVRAVHGGDLVGHRGHSIGADVGNHHSCALVGEQVRGGTPHAAGGTGHDRHLPGDRSGQSAQTPAVGRVVGRHGCRSVISVISGHARHHVLPAVADHRPGRI